MNMLLILLRHNFTLFIAGCSGIFTALGYPWIGAAVFFLAALLRNNE